MKIAILTFDGFNEIDSFVASYMINRVVRPGWKAEITCPAPVVASGRGVRISAQQPLEFAGEADAVLVGSGGLTGRLVEDREMMSRLGLDPRRQLIGSQCSGALILAKLGVLGTLPACTDRGTRPLLEAGGSPCPGAALLRERQRGDGRWLPVVALPRDLVRLASGWPRRGGGGARLRRPGGQESEYVSRAIGIVGEFMADNAGGEIQPLRRATAP